MSKDLPFIGIPDHVNLIRPLIDKLGFNLIVGSKLYNKLSFVVRIPNTTLVKYIEVL